jgi:hypothetical protein
MGFFSRLRRIRIQVAPGHVDLGSGAAEAAARLAEEEVASRPLLGPAGEHVYGPDPRTGRAHPTAPTAAAVADPARQAEHERAEREAARVPYLAPSVAPVLFTRIATRGADGPADVAAHLAASGLAGRPDLVYGVYRLPDHVGRNATSRARRYEEWDIVHAATEPLAPAPSPGHVFLDARQQWVARASGEPSVLDEDLAITLLQAAQIAPDRCLGVARDLASRGGGGGSTKTRHFVKMAVTGVHVFVPPGSTVAPALDRMAAASPVALPHRPPPGVHVEVMNWVAIAKAVHPRTGTPFLVPSPFPYLPSTPQELLKAYLDIVGVSPADCYSAQVTIDRTKDMEDREGSGWFTATSAQGQRQPCVDGKARPRLSGAARVVVAYHDRAEHTAGRERWAAYERDVLQARLANRTGTRRPVQPMELGSLGGAARTAIRAAGSATAVAGVVLGTSAGGAAAKAFEDIPDTRYCWPPTDIR